MAIRRAPHDASDAIPLKGRLTRAHEEPTQRLLCCVSAFETLGLTITTAAAALGVTRTTLSELVKASAAYLPKMAVRLSKVLGGSAESWLVQQAQYDLAQVRTERIKLKRLEFA